MAAGATDRVWTLTEIAVYSIETGPPPRSGRRQRSGRDADATPSGTRLLTPPVVTRFVSTAREAKTPAPPLFLMAGPPKPL